MKYRCITKNMEIINVDDVVLKELHVGDILETRDGDCYKVLKRQLFQIDETLVRCELIVKKVSNYKILYIRKNSKR
jgi:hypothetical protein